MNKPISAYKQVEMTSRDVIYENFRLLESMGVWLADVMNVSLPGGTRIEAARKVQKISEVFIENMAENLPEIEVITLTNIFYGIIRDCNKFARWMAKPRLNQEPNMKEVQAAVQFLISVFKK